MLAGGACSPDEPVPVGPQPPSDITLSQTSIDAGKDGGTFSLTVTAPSRPVIGVVPDWITIPDGTYNSETFRITYSVKVAANPATQERSAVISIKAGSLSKDLTVKQAAQEKQDDTPKTLTLDKHSLTLKQGGGSASVIVTAPQAATLSGVPNWLEVSQTEFQNYKMKFTFKAGANDSYEELKAEITVASGSLTDKVTVLQEAKEKEPEPSGNTAWKRTLELGLGWNLGNQLDAYSNDMPDETCWGNPKATQATFDKIKSYGFTTVRIPVTWLKKIGPAPDYTIDAAWMKRVAEVVGYAHKAGLNVIVNTHHDENLGDSHWLNIKGAVNDAKLNQTIKDEIKAVWTQIAKEFKDCGDWLMLESFNEINDGKWGWSDDFRANPSRQCNILNEWNQVFVDAVRATGGNNATRWLGVPTYAANPEYEKYFKMPSDKAGKLMMSVHFYDPSDYTIGEKQYSDWGHTGNASLKANGGDEDHVKEVFGNLYNKYIDKDIPVYIGEFGCSMRDKAQNRAWKFYLYYLEYVVKAARTYGLPCCLWDNGGDGSAGQEHHGYVNHGTGAYMGNAKTPVETMVKAWTSTDSAYTLQSVYDSAPQF